MDPERSGIGYQLLGLSGESPQPGLPLFRQPVRSYLRHVKIVISF